MGLHAAFGRMASRDLTSAFMERRATINHRRRSNGGVVPFGKLFVSLRAIASGASNAEAEVAS